MAAATVAVNANRIGVGFLDVAAVPITITLSGTPYATATGGFAFDIAALLNAVGPPESGINPNDVYYFVGKSASNFLAANFALGTPTWTTPPDIANPGSNVKGVLATAPCTLRLFGTGSGNLAALGEIADSTPSPGYTTTVSGLLLVCRGGHN